MLRLALLVVALLLTPAPSPALTPEEEGELTLALDVLAGAPEPEAGTRAFALLRSPAAGSVPLENALVAWFAARDSTAALADWLRGAALGGPADEAGFRLQEALAAALVTTTAVRFERLLRTAPPDALAAEPARLEDLRTRLQLLGDLAYRAGGLSAASRRAHAARLGRLVAEHAALLRADVTLDPAERPKLPALRAQLTLLLRDLPRPFDADAFVAGAGLSGLHAQIARRYGVVVLDDNRFDLAQLDAIEQVLSAIPAELHRLTHISQHILLGNWVENRPEVTLHGSIGVNLADLPVFSDFENPFPPDAEPRKLRVFCGVLQHELNHTVDERTVGPDPVLRARVDQLLARAGRTDALQYLRSMFPPETFPDAPQELFASISNQYLTDSLNTLALARTRLAEGRSAPLDQFLFFADVYAQGRDTTLFFVQDEDCNYSAYPVRVRRDGRGRIDGLAWPGGELALQLDREGFVVR